MKNLFKNTSGSVVGVQPNPIFLSTLENSGYNNYTAIADIVDNSLESTVDAKNVWIVTNPSKTATPSKEIKNIFIIDDGTGMDIATLCEAFKLGATTGKDASFDLGNYGTGLKSAGLSMGRKIIVRTKQKDGDFLVALFDKEEMVNKNTWNIPIGIGSNEEYKKFKSLTNSEQGTVIEISSLKPNKLPKYTTIFRDTLIKKMGLYYKYILEEKNIDIFVNDKKVEPIDPMFTKESFSKRISELKESFIYNNKEYTFNCYYLESLGQHKSEELGISQATAGIYIYRNYRLIGEGLKLGVISKHNSINAFRCELFVDGEDDFLFNSTYMKIIHEKDKNDIDQGFKDKLENAIKGYFSTVKTNVDNRRRANNEESENTKNATKDAEKEINKNKFVVRKRKLGEPTEIKEKKPIINEGKNAFAHRTRGEWCKVKYVDNVGELGEFCYFTKDNGKLILNINKTHVFFDEFIDKSDAATINTIIKLLASFGLAQEEKMGYFDNTEMEVMIDEFMKQWSETLRKLMKF